MHILRRSVLGLAILAAFTKPGVSHSLDDVDRQLDAKEPYFQAEDRDVQDFTLQDTNGRIVSLADLRGKIVVLNFIYTSCPDFCPLHTEKLAEVQEMIGQTPMKDQVAFVTITTDPSRDDRQVLRDYATARGIDLTNWTFLTTAPGQPESTTRNLAKAYGLEFSRSDDGYQMHGVVTHVIDRSGRLRARFHGLDFEPANLVIFVNALVNDVARPHDEPGLWDKVKNLF